MCGSYDIISAKYEELLRGGKQKLLLYCILLNSLCHTRMKRPRQVGKNELVSLYFECNKTFIG